MQFEVDRCLVYDGALWRAPRSRVTYRWHVWRDARLHETMATVTRIDGRTGHESTVHGGFPGHVAVAFKARAREEGLAPVRRRRKDRHGPYVELWWGD